MLLKYSKNEKRINTVIHNYLNKILMLLISLLIITPEIIAQKPYRVGTTIASFLEVGYGAAGNSMGDAYTALANDASSVYWNPAGIASLETNSALFSYQPWIANINSSFVSANVYLPSVGVFALSLISMNYGQMDVTTLLRQEGNGETFQASDLAIGLTFARKLAQWFAFGATFKYISSSIWHTSASSIAIDLGVTINTDFLSLTGDFDKGLVIAMSVSNYGTPMTYDGIDLIYPIDIAPDENGNYKDTPGQFKMQSWELPLIFRFGIAAYPIVIGNHQLSVAVDALHPNNNSEYINVGGEYKLTFPAFGEIFIRGGYKGIFMDKSLYGLSFGFGLKMFIMDNNSIRLNYAFREHKVLGDTQTYEITISF